MEYLEQGQLSTGVDMYYAAFVSITERRDVNGKVNPRGEVAAVPALTCKGAAGGKTATMIHNFKTYTSLLTEGFTFYNGQEALKQAEKYASQYCRTDLFDPFAGQPILE